MIHEWTPTGKPDKPAPQPTAAQLELRQKRAKYLCRYAANKTSWILADKLAKLWDCEGCRALGVDEPEQ